MYSYPTKLRIFSACFLRIRPSAIANITHKANPHRSFICTGGEKTESD
jgi:hypothetical protein